MLPQPVSNSVAGSHKEGMRPSNTGISFTLLRYRLCIKSLFTSFSTTIGRLRGILVFTWPRAIHYQGNTWNCGVKVLILILPQTIPIHFVIDNFISTQTYGWLDCNYHFYLLAAWPRGLKRRFDGYRVITIEWYRFNSHRRRTRCCVLVYSAWWHWISSK